MPLGRAFRPKLIKSQERPSGLQEAATSLYLDRQANGCSAATLYWYKRYVGALLEWLAAEGVTEPEQVTATHLRKLLADLRERGLKDSTRHHYSQAARTFFTFCVDEGILDVSPMARVKNPKPANEILPALTPEEAKRLVAACDTVRDRAIVLCLLDTGCRAREFCNLKIGDVDVEAGTVTVRLGKGKKDRTTYIGKQARRALNKYITGRTDRKATDPLWVTEREPFGALSQRGLQKALYRIGERAKVEHCHPHTFRRTMALWSLRNGMNIYALQRIMGHADLEILRRYLALVEQDLQEAHEEHGAVDHML